MNTERVERSAGAAVILSLLYCIGGVRAILALVPAVAVHELGHVAALRLLGLRIRELRLEPSGLCIRYSGRTTALGELLAALSGPAAGLLYTAATSVAGAHEPSGTLRLSAGLSLLFSAFNLLPALPLDGGRALRTLLAAWRGEERGASLSSLVSGLTGAALLLIGLRLLLEQRGAALLAAGAWIVIFNIHQTPR